MIVGNNGYISRYFTDLSIWAANIYKIHVRNPMYWLHHLITEVANLFEWTSIRKFLQSIYHGFVSTLDAQGPVYI